MTLAVLILEDEAEVREALERDLDEFWNALRLETAEDVDDAWQAVRSIDHDGDDIALILADHRLPGRSGVDFLIDTMEEPATLNARRVLVTGQADHSDTIRAVNDASLDYYIAKPWNRDELVATVRRELTTYVLDMGVDPLAYMPLLDAVRIMDAMR